MAYYVFRPTILIERYTRLENMTISLSEFITRLAVSPVLRITVLLILGVIMVNGWTDAPNAIASLVASGGMKLGAAVRMAAAFNFAGLFLMSAVNTRVAFTVYHIADFGEDGAAALAALCAALSAIILWSAAAWCFGIPTSESHALLAGLTGASVALRHGFTGVHMQEWGKVLYGLGVSVTLGFLLGWLGGKLLRIAGSKALFAAVPCKGEKCTRKQLLPTAGVSVPYKGEKCPGHCRVPEPPGGSVFHKAKKGITDAQIAGAAAMAFMHGAQDGQKFMGVFLLGVLLAEGKGIAAAGQFVLPFWMMILCSSVMAMGTLIGGERIIKTVGNDMVRLGRMQGAAADGAGALCLLFCSLAGIPVSTTHVKTTAVMGVGAAGARGAVNMGIVKEMLFAWLITFPCCGIIGYLTAGIFLRIIR